MLDEHLLEAVSTVLKLDLFSNVSFVIVVSLVVTLNERIPAVIKPVWECHYNLGYAKYGF